MIVISRDEWRAMETIAAHWARRFPMAEVEDIVQEIGLWAVENEELVVSWRDEPWGWRERFRRFNRVARAYCEKERAQWYGYKPEDVYYYSHGQLKKLLPLAIEGYTGLLAKTDEKVVSGGDPATGGDLMAMVADVRKALKALDPLHKERLYRAAIRSFDYSEFPNKKERDKEHARVRRALGALQKELGGPDPYKEYTGQRKAMSNAQARAILRNQERR